MALEGSPDSAAHLFFTSPNRFLTIYWVFDISARSTGSFCPLSLFAKRLCMDVCSLNMDVW